MFPVSVSLSRLISLPLLLALLLPLTACVTLDWREQPARTANATWRDDAPKPQAAPPRGKVWWGDKLPNPRTGELPGTPIPVGARLQLTIENNPGLSGPLTVDPTGRINLPLLGPFIVAGFSLPEAEKRIVAAYATGYSIKPRLELARAQ